MIENPKVSVTVMTYNQKDYIGQCLESLVTQECDFKYEIIVGDDASTDGTSDIVREYTNKYPDIIVPLIHEKNLGPSGNFFSIVELAKGDYIAHMDGDDYALPGKLQAQADFMDKTPDCNICFHRVKALFLDGTIKDDLIDYEKIKDGFERKDLLSIGSVGSNSSKMYRADLKKDLQEFRKFSSMMDFFANAIQIKDKKIMYVSDQLYGVYRVGVGIMLNVNIVNTRLDNLNLLNKLFPNMKRYINTYAFTLFLADIKNGRFFAGCKHFKFYFKTFHILAFNNFVRLYPLLKYFRVPK